MNEKTPEKLRDFSQPPHPCTLMQAAQKQAMVDCEYIRFLELLNQRLERLCRQAKAALDLALYGTALPHKVEKHNNG